MKESIQCVVIAFYALCGCNPILHMEEKERKAVENCLTNVPSAVEFSKCFPQNRAFVTRFMDDKPLQTFNMETALFQRYILRMQVSVTFDDSRTKLVRSGVPKFVLDKVESISSEDGRSRITFNSDNEIQTVISLSEWKAVVERTGDVTVLDREIVTNQPVWGFAEYWEERLKNNNKLLTLD